MRPSSVDTGDGLFRFADEHLAVVVAVLVRVTDAPALALDMASESIATAHRFAEQVGGSPSAGDQLRFVAEAAEHVFRETFERGRVPHRERMRARTCTPRTLTAAHLAEIKALGQRALDDAPFAQRLLNVLQRDTTSQQAVRTTATSPLVTVPRPADRESRS